MAFERLRQWSQHSLANSFALSAVIIAIGSSLMVALVSLLVIFWVEQTTIKSNLQEKARRLTERVEGSIRVVESATADLSLNPMFTTALLDSPGRNTYVVPFLENYRFPVTANSGLALCDLNGERLAGTRSAPSECRADSPLFKQVLATGEVLREVAGNRNGHVFWIIYQGVAFTYTGTIEGVVVAQLDLHDVLRDAPRDLDLEGVALMRAGTSENLVSIEVDGIQANRFGEAHTPLFEGRPDASPFPIEAVVRDHHFPFDNKLMPLALGYGFGGLLLVLAVVYWSRGVSRQLIEPLSELTKTARSIAGSGDLSITVPGTTEGEVRQLATAFHMMVGTLRASEATLEEKVAQRTAALMKSEAAADAANIAKSRFLATMSHEIRTPMNGILGMAQMLLTPEIKPSERNDYARTILSSGQMLLNVLNDILDFSKAEAGKFELESVALEPGQLVRETLALFAGSASRKGLRLEIDGGSLVGQRYMGDPHRLRQMLANLVNNAIKFTEQGGVRIAVRELERDDRFAMLEFTVTDTGIGVPADKQSLLFEPFSQTGSSTTRKYGGSGLGLSIVRNLARLMGGVAGVTTEAGQGSRFWFFIRAGLVAADAHNPQSERPPDAQAGPDVANSLLDPEVATPITVVKELDTERLVSLIAEISPLLAQNKFDAFTRFKELQTLTAGTRLEAAIQEIEGVLLDFRYDLALERLRHIAAIQSDK